MTTFPDSSVDNRSATLEPTAAQRRSDAYALSPLQQGMLFHWQLDPRSGTDVEQIVGDLHESIDPARFDVAWQQAAAAFSTLRTSFRWEGLASPQQHIEPTVAVPFVFEDLRAKSGDEVSLHLAEFLTQDRREGFDLSRPPAMRVHLFQIADAHFRMVWTFHHIVIDGRAFAPILNAVFRRYAGERVMVDDQPYRAYVDWLDRQDLEPSRAFWKAKLAGFATPTAIPAEAPPCQPAERYAHRHAHLSLEVTERLRALAQREALTVNTLLLSAWGLMLARYSGDQDIVLGATKTTRRGTIDNADAIAGLFLATIPLRLKADPELTVLQWLHHVRDEWVSLRGFEHLPLVEIRQASEVPGSRLFDALFVFETEQLDTRLRAQGGAWTSRRFEVLEQTGFPLTLAAYGDAELALKIEFDTARLSPTAIDFMLGHLTTLLDTWGQNPSGTLAQVSMLTAMERRQVLKDWNASSTEFPRDASIHDLVSEQAARRPGAIAVECEGELLTYAELEERSNALAAALIRAGVAVGDHVGLFAERSIAYVVASLAVLKAGAAYMPLEPGYPKDRLLYMMAEAGARLVLAPRHLEAQLIDYVKSAESAPRILVIDAVDDRGPNDAAAHVVRDPGNAAAYVMFTSGSSGPPKGVEVTHRGVVRLVRNTNYMDFTADDVMLGLATTMFDASTWETWTALLNGGRLVLLPAGLIDIATVGDLVERAGVTTLLFSVALFQQVVEAGLEQYRTVKQFLVGGDVAPVPHLRRALDALPNCQFVNAYGPTENAVITCAYPLPAHQPVCDPVPIGPPVANTQAYILDVHGEPAPVLVTGELFAGGSGVGVGYVNRPELSAERFLPDRFTNEPGARLYRTGDRARWRSDGLVEFAGRVDNQVKIRGYRIEPGEVEAAMLAVPGVRAAAIAVRAEPTGQKRLLGYYVPVAGQELTPAAVRAELRTKLPDYMVPAAIVEMAELPLNNSGKVDRKALPEPPSDGGAAASDFSRPLSRAQRQLAQIWENLLAHRPIGIDDDFFEIGGHSLLAVRMIAEAEQATGRRVTLATLLERPTIRHIAQRIDLATLAEPEPPIVVLQPNGKQVPFVFVHGDLTGGGWYCRKLAPLISRDMPMVVLPTFRPPESGEPLTIEVMAERHLAELRKIQPKGPYRLGGFCASGLVALEMAHALVRAGERVERLVLVDSVNPNPLFTRWRPLIDRLVPATPIRAQFARRHRLLTRLKYFHGRVRDVTSMKAVDLARWAVNTVRIRFPGARPVPKAAPAVPPEFEKKLLYMRAAAAYVPRRYTGAVELVFSSDPLDQFLNSNEPAPAAVSVHSGTDAVERGWSPLLPNARIRRIEGSHIGIIVEHLDQLGACLRGSLGILDG